jgi:hypothetical protein
LTHPADLRARRERTRERRARAVHVIFQNNKFIIFQINYGVSPLYLFVFKILFTVHGSTIATRGLIGTARRPELLASGLLNERGSLKTSRYPRSKQGATESTLEV